MSATLVMGPVLFNWKPEDWRDFYFRVADEANVDEVCVGEVVCSKRAPFFAPYLEEVVSRLLSADKKVTLSTLALIMNKREMEGVRDTAALIDAEVFSVEANDISAAHLLRGQPHRIGPYVNVYNEGTLAFLAKGGAQSVCLPVELGMDALTALAKSSPTALEVIVFGRLPLAISARCYHARAHDLHKDSCQFVCEKDVDGLGVETMDGEPFLAINGVQTLSHAYADMSGSILQLLKLGISRLRLSPHMGFDMVEVAKIFRAVSIGELSADDAHASITQLNANAAFCNGYIHNQPGYGYT